MSDDDNQHDDERDEPRGALTTPNRAGTMVRRDFTGSSMAVSSPVAEALAASERANVEARYIVAWKNPRDLADVRVRILHECRRPGFADVATYARPVGSQKNEKTGQWEEVIAEGLSIRFAEVALRNMGNMSCKASTLYDDAMVRMVRVTALDYETSGSWDVDLTIPKTVERSKLRKGQKPLGERENAYGDRVFIVQANDQQFASKCAAEISKASRTAILRLVPGHIQDEAFDLCKKIAEDRDAKDPDAAKNRLIDAFAEQGIRPPAIVQWLGHEIETGTREEFLQLSKIISGIRERELIWSDVLAERIAEREARTPRKPAPATAQPTDAAKATESAVEGTAKPAAAPDPKPEPAATTRPPAAPQQAQPSRSGKGAAALKGALRGGSAAAGFVAKATEDQREAEPGWMSGKPDAESSKAAPVELPPDTPPPAPGNEDRSCATKGCGAVIEVPIGSPPGQICYACAAANRDSE